MNSVITPVKTDERTKLGIRSGDTVRVHQKIVEKGKTRTQAFEGLVIAVKHGTEAGASFTVRATLSGIGVERVFPLFAPFIETLVFQYFLIEYLFPKTSSGFREVILSSIAFGLTHYYSIYYIILSFVTALFLGYAYILARRNKLPPSAFIIVFIIHFLYNLITFFQLRMYEQMPSIEVH